MQPSLFEISETTNREIVDRATAAKRLSAMLVAMRRKTVEFDHQRIFIEDITKWLEQTKAKGKATPTQIEGLILYAIEKQQAWTLTEICDELKLDRKFIKEKIAEMEKAGLVRVVKKYVPHMFKTTFLIKSNRAREPEAI